MTPVHALALLAGVLLALGARAQSWLPAPGLGLPAAALGLRAPALALVALAVAAFLLRCLPRWRALASLIVGFLLACQQLHDYAQARLPDDFDDRLLVSATIEGLPLRRGAELGFTALLQPVRATPEVAGTLRAQLRWADAPPVHAGERWQLLAALHAPSGAANPGGADASVQDLRLRRHALGQVLASPLNRQLASSCCSLDRLRERIAARIAATISERDAAALVIALAIGDTQRVSPEQWRVFNANGITHLVAISGLHVTLFCVLTSAAMAALWRRWAWLQPRVACSSFAALLGLAASCAYALLAGWSVPTQRTLLMLAAWHALRIAARPRRASHTLAIGLAGVLLLDPLAPLAAGFWLSFLAVAALLLGTAVGGPAQHGWRALLAEQGWVAIALLPVTLAVFGSMSLAGLVVNLLAIPFFSLLLVPLILAATLGLALWPLAGTLLLKGAALLVALAWPLLHTIAQSPFALWHADPPAWWFALAAAALGLALLPWRAWMRASALVALLPLLLPVRAEIPVGSFTATVFDTGGGEATLVRTATHALLYDNGEVWGSRGQVSAARLLPALRHYHVASLDRLLLPRLDTDRGAGVTALRAALPVTGLAAGGGRQLPPEIVPCTSGERWRWDAVEFEVLAGPACSLRVAVPGTAAALLLPGSADAAAQTHSIAPGLAATAVVLVPGHGSAVARSAALMAASGAQWAILSATARAACRSGVSATLAAWRSTGAQTWVTGQQGALELDFLATGAITVTGWRKPQSGQRRSVSCAVGKNVELTSRCGKSCVPADG